MFISIMQFQVGRMREASGQCKPQSPFPTPLLPNSVSYALLFLTYTVPSFKTKKVKVRNEGKSKTQTHVTLRHTPKATETQTALIVHQEYCAGHKGFCEKHLPS